MAHHGSRTSSTEPFVDAVRPAFAIISAGYENSFGNPHPAVVGRFGDLHTLVLRTDQDGLVSVRSTDARSATRRRRRRGAHGRSTDAPGSPSEARSASSAAAGPASSAAAITWRASSSRSLGTRISYGRLGNHRAAHQHRGNLVRFKNAANLSGKHLRVRGVRNKDGHHIEILRDVGTAEDGVLPGRYEFFGLGRLSSRYADLVDALRNSSRGIVEYLGIHMSAGEHVPDRSSLFLSLGIPGTEHCDEFVFPCHDPKDTKGGGISPSEHSRRPSGSNGAGGTLRR